jgi:hypothetical protein
MLSEITQTERDKYYMLCPHEESSGGKVKKVGREILWTRKWIRRGERKDKGR